MSKLKYAFLTLAAVFSLAIAAPTASAEVFEGGVTDPTGDSPSPDRDLTGATTVYDNEAGTITFTLNLAAADTGAPVQIATGIGTLNANGSCGYPLGVVGSLRPDGAVLWIREDTGDDQVEGSGDATIDIQGSTVVLTASDEDLRGLTPNCGEAVLSSADGNQTFDTTNAFTVAPRPKRPKLNLSITGPGQMKRGGKAKVKVTVGNTGDGAAASVKAGLSAKGAKVTGGSRKGVSIAPNASSSFAFTVKAGKKAKGKIKLRAKVTALGSNALSGTKTIKIKKKGKKPQPPKPVGGGDLTGKLFWGFEEYRWDRSPDILGLYFANSKFVHWGIPKGGLKNCSKVTAKPDEDGEMQPGCLRYSYNEKSGRISIGKAKGTYRKGDLKLKMDSEMWRIDGKTWYPGAFAKAGSRFKVTLINRGYFGACGITPYCSTWAEYLTLEPSGQFGRTRSSLTTGGGGALPFIAVGSYPPEDRGTYEVLSNGRIRFNYDNGETGVETLTIQTNKQGKPDAANEGVLLDDVWFYKDDEE